MKKQLQNLNLIIIKPLSILNSFYIMVLVLFILILICNGTQELNAQRLSRDLNIDLFVNQVGYVPLAGKIFVTKGIRNAKFDVINLETQKVAYSGVMKPNPGDFGEYSVGDFTSLTREGHYYIKSDTSRSYPFAISKTVYQKPMNLIEGYFSLQRCGASTTGYLSPCHLDDGIRMDNGKHQDVSGGWHDASDLRKWVDAIIYGMIGLGKTYDLQDEKSNNRDKILDELKWGNQYFLKMQEPQGYVMNWVGGDVKKHADSNRWTDSEIGPEGGVLGFVKPNAGKSTGDMLIFGSNDDRVIRTDPTNMFSQYNFITSEAIMARITKAKDPNYSQKCLLAAIKCFDWCAKSNKGTNSSILGSSIQASIEMYKTTRQDIYKNFAVEQASQLKKLQVVSQEGSVGGFFYISASNQQPFKPKISDGCVEFISLCDLIKEFPSHQDVSSWKEMIANYANQYLLFFSQKNSFGIVPYGLYSKQDPGGDRRVGNYWYRYFMQPELSWWVGINANLASAGVGLIKAAGILKDPKLKALAQKQLDWIIGVNPFNSSTIELVGYNQPKHYGGGGFNPATPIIPGAVLNGLGGDHNDQPVPGNGDWQTSEYWTPMVAYTLWLMAEISKYEN